MGLTSNMNKQTVDEVRDRIARRVRREFGVTVKSAAIQQVYQAAALCVRDDIMDVWADERERSKGDGRKNVVYLCAEYLIGRAFTNNLINLGMYETYEKALEELGFDIGAIEEQEADAGLGNGGLGRLAACFLDSLSTLNIPSIGFGIRYEYGFFRQEIHDGMQREMPDTWSIDRDVWEAERADRVFPVQFGGQVEEQWGADGRLKVVYHNAQTVLAEACDIPIVGYRSKLPATLRLWRAHAPSSFDLTRFNQGDFEGAVAERELAESISKVLYPDDSHNQGQELRLRQFYFLVSATMQFLVQSHKNQYGDLRTFADKIAVQINDTHPALAVPEFIRILIDEEGFTWEEAVDLAQRTFNYTNHTILPEALECWPAETMQRLLPRIYRIIETIDARFRDRVWRNHPGDADLVGRMAIINGGKVRMANLCVLSCGHVNGVSQLHGRILQSTVFRDFYTVYPERFCGITNGVTQRRWLGVANPRLRRLVDDTIGEGFMTDWRKISELEPFAADASFRQAYDQVKAANKVEFSNWMLKSRGVEVDPAMVIDAQAKRLHEYKRQLMKALHILAIYDGIVEGRAHKMPPTTFVFAAKAAPGYKRAKDIIRLINSVAKLVSSDERTRDLIRVVFLENYDVTAAQHLVAAADISEQISTAGMEASGTSNMKFMLNGALTLGTMDGANIEIAEQVGPKNIFIFGARVEELDRMKAEGSYNPRAVVEANPHLQRVLRHLVDGSLPTSDGSRFEDIYYSLAPEGGQGDAYFVLHDFASYDQVFAQVMSAYVDRDRWISSAVVNTAKAGYFSSDRAIEDYANQIWQL
ncbi:Maltodextrin phosphorylase [Slackia heliotrinireducens]|uniref:Alpha-1,4 glucan phosphorylase n=1 Tax=Slackia heliotrinireducens (strain ATCC 29202 / DSM 20476 / NCTC 11029 / RHS 1) TaxID=471855 RepID=C7N737_SLAHD|nr:glycogen/starch/alpha-glucan phosphorylase [Slackia heliotrinireducens]ACV22722.1 glycogen/starch/alpha-glucan phosphorylase [Slackia heliotrinireducens DSM 20476]VEH01350.1 Maltodextrin phosphorylase [Slackia heliotrinireducens]